MQRALRRVAGIPEGLLKKLTDAKIATVDELLSHAEPTLATLLDLSVTDLEALFNAVFADIAPLPTNALQELQKRSTGRTGVVALDALLGGGLTAGAITEVVGPPGSGKSQFCLTTAVVGALLVGTGVVYIDTEGSFSPVRLLEIARARATPGQDLTALAQNCTLIRVNSAIELKNQLATLESMVFSKNVTLVIIDSIAAVARRDFGASLVERQSFLLEVASTLKSVAERCNLAVLVSNHVSARGGSHSVAVPLDPSGRLGRAALPPRPSEEIPALGDLLPALGTAWTHAVNTRLLLTGAGDAPRELQILKSPVVSAVSLRVVITRAGVEAVADQ
ncbi:putative DNA repair protein RAD51 2 [Paratrimastix pyriformis]|uniref:DNA repair protein RAD51 2 n=1 Tax=Paratrimastix pyriformis TaxID=342808 RepID=A0ABQ8UDN4_9EUKA|nr:putative DNA repair protein RAD51 2 [Paratrimastix pyriformis]